MDRPFLKVKASKRSLKKDRVSCERIKAFFSDRSLDSILTSEIEAYKQKRLGEIDRFKRLPKKSTINRELACLRSILLLAARDRILEKTPYVELFEEKNTRSKVIAEQEFSSLLAVSPRHLQEILICLWDSGMREAEALTLTWNRVNLKSRFIRLDATDTKTEEGRLVPISPRLKALLQAIWQRERAGKLSALTIASFSSGESLLSDSAGLLKQLARKPVSKAYGFTIAEPHLRREKSMGVLTGTG
jgi:integrase